MKVCTIVGGGGAESLEVSELVHAGAGLAAGAGVLHLGTIISYLVCTQCH